MYIYPHIHIYTRVYILSGPRHVVLSLSLSRIRAGSIHATAAAVCVPEVKRALYEAVTADKVSSPARALPPGRGLFRYCTQVAVQCRAHISLSLPLFFALALVTRTAAFFLVSFSRSLSAHARARGHECDDTRALYLTPFTPTSAYARAELSSLENSRVYMYVC